MLVIAPGDALEGGRWAGLRHCHGYSRLRWSLSRCDPCADKRKYRGQQLDQKDGFVLLRCRCSTSRVLETRLWCRDCSQSLWVQSGPSDIGFPSSFCAGPVQLSAALATERITPSSPKCDYGPCCELDDGVAAAVAGVSPVTAWLSRHPCTTAALSPSVPAGG